MSTRFQSRLVALAKDAEREIELDTRKKESADIVSREAADRIRANTNLLNSLKARLNGHSVTEATTPKAPVNLLSRRPRSKKAMRKLDFVAATIATVKPSQEFTPGSILTEMNRLYPNAGITRAQLSHLIWKLSTLPEGQKMFKQIEKNGGNVEARYVRLEEGPLARLRVRPTQPVPEADVFEALAAQARAGANGK